MLDGLNKNIAKDAFGYSLNYYAADYKPIGTIAVMGQISRFLV
jgi:hypothetical protein